MYSSVLDLVVCDRVSYQNTSLFRNLAKYTNIPHVCCPNFDSIPIYLILGVRYTNIPHVFLKFQKYTNIPPPWFVRAKIAYQYTSCFRKMAKYTNIPQFNEYEETITSPLLYRYLPYIICAQCMNNVIWIFLVSTWNCRVKLIEILSVPAVPWYHTLLGYYIAWLELGSHAWLELGSHTFYDRLDHAAHELYDSLYPCRCAHFVR